MDFWYIVVDFKSDSFVPLRVNTIYSNSLKSGFWVAAVGRYAGPFWKGEYVCLAKYKIECHHFAFWE